MEVSNVIALLALISTILIFIVNFFQSLGKDNKDDTKVLISLNTEMKYNTKQLENIEKKLVSIENKLDDTAQKTSKHDSDIKTLFKYVDLHLYRIRRIENHVGIKGDEDGKE